MDIGRRLGKTFLTLNKIWLAGDIGRHTKVTLFKSFVIIVLMYGCETATMTTKHEKRIDALQVMYKFGKMSVDKSNIFDVWGHGPLPQFWRLWTYHKCKNCRDGRSNKYKQQARSQDVLRVGVNHQIYVDFLGEWVQPP